MTGTSKLFKPQRPLGTQVTGNNGKRKSNSTGMKLSLFSRSSYVQRGRNKSKVEQKIRIKAAGKKAKGFIGVFLKIKGPFMYNKGTTTGIITL